MEFNEQKKLTKQKQTHRFREQTDSCPRGWVLGAQWKRWRDLAKRNLIDKDNSVVITRGKGGGEVEEGKGNTNDDRRRTDLGWRTLNTRWCIIELYTWSLYNFISLCHPNKFKIFFKETKSHLWQSLGKFDPSAQLTQSIYKAGMPQVGHMASIPHRAHPCLVLPPVLDTLLPHRAPRAPGAGLRISQLINSWLLK